MDKVQAHYSQPKLGDKILAALEAAGKNLHTLTLEDLHPLDEFHSMGLKATRDLAKLAGVKMQDKVLDIGCGIGGPARVGMDSNVIFRQGDATALPFPDNSFDVVWSQHVVMNIEEKAAMYAEVARVLRPGGRYAFQEICSGTNPVRYPVPWAGDNTVSFLSSTVDFNSQLQRAGLRESICNNVTAAAFEWFQRIVAKGGPPPVSIAILMGDTAQEKIQNLAYNYENDCICMLQGVLGLP